MFAQCVYMFQTNLQAQTLTHASLQIRSIYSIKTVSRLIVLLVLLTVLLEYINYFLWYTMF